MGGRVQPDESRRKSGIPERGLGGIKALKARVAHFAASDAPLTASELFGAPEILQIPSASVGVVPIYNLPEVPNLTLDGTVLAEIYLGRIQSWDDPKIAALNPGVALPAQHIVAVYRAEECNTGHVFANFLGAANEEWNTKVVRAPKLKWPIGAPAHGSEEVVRIVAGVLGTVGFVELSFAEKEKLAAKSMVARALPLRASDDDLYPIRGVTYVLIEKDLTHLKDRKQAEELVKYVRWCSTSGMKLAQPAFGILSAENRAEVESLLKTVEFDGKRVGSRALGVYVVECNIIEVAHLSGVSREATRNPTLTARFL